MADTDDIAAAITDNAVGPAEVRVGNEMVRQHTAEDQIALANFSSNRAAAKRRGFPLMSAQLVPSGTG